MVSPVTDGAQVLWCTVDVTWWPRKEIPKIPADGWCMDVDGDKWKMLRNCLELAVGGGRYNP